MPEKVDVFHVTIEKERRKAIKPLLVISCMALAMRLLMDETHPLRAMFGTLQLPAMFAFTYDPEQ